MAAEQRQFVTVVSGLPRSGTSMMMRMLEAGGMPVLTDGVRQADDDNPRGYFEFEAVKKKDAGHDWLATAQGKAVKIIYRLLYDLPADCQYRVVFMQRQMSEILASQRKMLERKGEQGSALGQEQLAGLFRKELERVGDWLTGHASFTVHEVSYNDLLSEPRPLLEGVDQFLGGGFDLDAMATVVDASLYRNRS